MPDKGVPDVELRGVSRRYAPPPGESATDEVRAVDNVSLRVGPREFFSLLGPSGCGKTTTLRMIAGFVVPNDGEILIRGEDVRNVPPYRRNVNTTFQSYALFPHLDVFENIAFGLRRKGMRKAEIGEKVAWALSLVRLEGFERRSPRDMSGGEQQRVAMARALVNMPAVLLLDEPLSALDEKLRRHMQLELKRIQREIGITFILVTHDQEEALTLSDTIAVMNRGRVEQVGPPRALYESPATRFVAEFIGATNFLDGTAVERGFVRLAGGQTVRVPENDPAGAAVQVCVRPEKMWLAARVETGSLNALPGKIVDVVYQGAVTRYRFALEGGAQVFVTRQNTEPAAFSEDAAAELFVHWAPDASRVYQS
ncbi:MAG: ABC transporter ATP-binding protein [Armatimonadetes bacterium]|nr:ABC transporter ATP-binding protein [Armatimonadota bacterium]